MTASLIAGAVVTLALIVGGTIAAWFTITLLTQPRKPKRKQPW